MEYSDQTLHISDLATLDGANYVIEDSEFKDCILRGPAVVMQERTEGGAGIDIPGFNADGVIIEAEVGRTVLPVGVVMIRDCKFENCTFEGVSFFGGPAEMATLRKTMMRNVPAAGTPAAE